MQYASNKGGNAEHEYRTLNGKVVYEKIGSGSTAKIMVFSYDAQGRPFAVKYSTNNGGSYITYFYALNQQGDVVKIFRPLPSRDSNGNLNGLTEAVYATYTYDAWGNILSQSGGMASANPLRYRGYYYDTETGFYYLQSRYYDPANHRFINADSYASTGQGFLGYNMFAYCSNKPVNNFDNDGHKIKDGTKIQGGEGELLGILQQLTDDTLAYEGNQIVIEVEASNVVRNTGTNLVRELITSSSDVTVFTTHERTLAGSITFSGYSRLRNKENDSLIVLDLNQGPYLQVPNYIILGHELIHAYRFMNGERKASKIGCKWARCNMEELLTTGLSYVYRTKYSENQIRSENGLCRRTAY